MDTQVKADRARRILDDEVFQEAIAEVDARIVQEWRVAESIQEQAKLHARQAALQYVLRELRRMVSAGEMDAMQQEREGKRG